VDGQLDLFVTLMQKLHDLGFAPWRFVGEGARALLSAELRKCLANSKAQLCVQIIHKLTGLAFNYLQIVSGFLTDCDWRYRAWWCQTFDHTDEWRIYLHRHRIDLIFMKFRLWISCQEIGGAQQGDCGMCSNTECWTLLQVWNYDILPVVHSKWWSFIYKVCHATITSHQNVSYDLFKQMEEE
jgi:hypothetical protein